MSSLYSTISGLTNIISGLIQKFNGINGLFSGGSEGQVLTKKANNVVQWENTINADNYVTTNEFDSLSSMFQNHTHTNIDNDIAINGNVTISGISYSTGFIRHTLPSGSYDIIYTKDYDTSIPASTLISPSGSILRDFIHIRDDYQNKHTICSLSRSASYINNKETYQTRLRFYGPYTSNKNCPSAFTQLSITWITNQQYPYLSWNLPTIGYGNQLPRLDWVKDRIKNYAFPNYDLPSNITSAWPTSGWTNYSGNGFIVLSLRVGKNSGLYANVTLYKKTSSNTGNRIGFWGDMNGTEINACTPIPVLSGETYCLKGIATGSNAGSIASFTAGTDITPTAVYFYPIKY